MTDIAAEVLHIRVKEKMTIIHIFFQDYYSAVDI